MKHGLKLIADFSRLTRPVWNWSYSSCFQVRTRPERDELLSNIECRDVVDPRIETLNFKSGSSCGFRKFNLRSCFQITISVQSSQNLTLLKILEEKGTGVFLILDLYGD